MTEIIGGRTAAQVGDQLRAALYVRVSTREQMEGYSPDAQRETLEAHAAHHGVTVVETISDDGYSGADRHRPGLGRVMELAEAGEIDLVLAAKRDRFFRSRLYRLLMDEDLKEMGVRLVALNDTQNRLADGFLDDFAEYEREQIRERTMTGKAQKAREGKILRGQKAPFGFSYDAAGEALVPNEAEVPVLERLFGMAADGMGPQAIQTRLNAGGVPSPTGKAWNHPTIRQILKSDLYKPHARDELAGLIPEASLERLDADEAGVWWHGRKRTRVTGRTLSGIGVKERTKTDIRPVEERVGVPVPALLPRALVDEAHAMLKTRKPKTLKHEAREWELRGLVRCSCGWKMGTHTARSGGNGKVYPYFVCNQRRQYGKACGCKQKAFPAEDLERRVWRAVGALLSEPGRVLAELDRMISRARGRAEGDPRREERTLVGRLAELDRRRDGYVDLAADGDISRDILREKLAQVDAAKREVERELAATRDRGRQVGELEALRDDWAGGKFMWFSYADGLDHRSSVPEQRRETYRRHRLSVNVEEGGEIVLEGTFGRSALCGTETPCSRAS